MIKRFYFICLFALCAVVTNAQTPSGIYIRGDVNSWGSPAEWEFTDNGDGTYTLQDKELYGNFKVADESYTTYNYGGPGTIAPGYDFGLNPGTMSNISCGDAVYECETITLTIPAEGQATLRIEGTVKSDDEPLTCVYVIGDNVGWNFQDPSGKLDLTDEEGVFEGVVTLKAAADAEPGAYCFWRIYENLGRGSWGFEANATENTLSGTFTKGKEGCATTLPGNYTVRFDINTGEFTLTESTEAGVGNLAGEEMSIVASDGEIRVNGAATVAIYNVCGQRIAADSNATSFSVPAGIYVVVADGKTMKVAVR